MIKVEYGYVHARIRGMKSRLLNRKELEDLAVKFDVDLIISELEKTPYRAEIEEARVQYSGVTCVEEALRRNLANTFGSFIVL